MEKLEFHTASALTAYTIRKGLVIISYKAMTPGFRFLFPAGSDLKRASKNFNPFLFMLARPYHSRDSPERVSPSKIKSVAIILEFREFYSLLVSLTGE